MAQALADRYQVIDSDTHVSEPPDLWTSRVSVEKWGDLVPHVRHDPKRGEDRWWFGDVRGTTVANFCMAGWGEFPPDHPKTLEEGDPGCYDPRERLKRMDEYGIHAQVLYPNVIGFSAQHFLGLKDPELMLECVRAYNDFLIDFANESGSPDRFIPVMALPFWDVEASVKEIERGVEIGHKGILFGSEFQNFDRPPLGDRHWDPIWAAAQANGLSINFHTGSGGVSEFDKDIPEGYGRQAHFARISLLFFIGNSRAISDVAMSGICHRFPELNFVSVESGVGWLPYLIEAMDWQWKNSGAFKEHPDRELPSVYFRRQIYGCFWFEQDNIKWVVDYIPDNVLYETDYPHPTSMSPGPASFAENPRDLMEKQFEGVPEETIAKVLHGNAARLYHLD